MGHASKCFVSKYTEKDLKGTRGSGFPVDCNSDSEEHMQLLNHTAGLRNEVLRINQRHAFEIIELCSVPSPAGEQQDGWLSL